ncbi:MAG TPA: hypothetical protein DCS93_36050 [Microscillaceae bacterium]|nr:hypothetical protein [Microscillaceae bacterium]
MQPLKTLLLIIALTWSTRLVVAFQQPQVAMPYVKDSLELSRQRITNLGDSYRIDIDYPRFLTKPKPELATKLNKQVKTIVNHYTQRLIKRIDSLKYDDYLHRLGGRFEMYYNQNGFLSFALDFYAKYPNEVYHRDYAYYFTYDVNKQTKLTFGQTFILVDQVGWQKYLQKVFKVSVNSKVVDFVINDYEIMLQMKDRQLGRFMWLSDFWKYFKPKAPYQFLQGKIQSPNNRQTHQVATKETLFSICRRYQINQSDFRLWNGLGKSAQVNAGQSYYVAPPVVRAKYRAEVGDSVYKICRKFAIHASEFRRWNKLKKGAKIYKGRSYWVSAPGEE